MDSSKKQGNGSYNMGNGSSSSSSSSSSSMGAGAKSSDVSPCPAPLYVHCAAGGCRSVCAVVVYLVVICGVTGAEAMRWIHMMRWIANLRGEFLDDIEAAEQSGEIDDVRE